eukprot:4842169-Amphidinium_carterae.1
MSGCNKVGSYTTSTSAIARIYILTCGGPCVSIVLYSDSTHTESLSGPGQPQNGLLKQRMDCSIKACSRRGGYLFWFTPSA